MFGKHEFQSCERFENLETLYLRNAKVRASDLELLVGTGCRELHLVNCELDTDTEEKAFDINVRQNSETRVTIDDIEY